MRIRTLPLLAIAALLLPACEKRPKQKALDELRSSADEFQKEQLKKIDEGGLAVNEQPDTTRILDALDKAGDAASGQEKLGFELLKLFLQRVSDEGAKLTAVSADLAAGIDYSGVKEKGDLDGLSEKVRNYRRVNAEVKKGFSTELIENLKKDADRMGLTGQARADCFAGLEARFNRQLPLIHEIRDLDDQLCGVVLSQHDVLRKHFGNWTWEGGETGLSFSTDEAIGEFNALANELQAVAAKQAEVQRKLVSAR